MTNKENQIEILKLQGMKEQPKAFRSRRAASEFFIRSWEQKEIMELETAYLERACDALFHPAIKTLARKGEITFAFIKPNAFEGKNMSFDSSLPNEERDDLATNRVKQAIVRETKDGGGEILVDINIRLTADQARKFYEGLDNNIGEERFQKVIEFISSGPLTFLLLRHFKRDNLGRKIIQNDAVDWWRKRIGATNPEKAGRGTIRGRFGVNIRNNIVHGSDSKQSVIKEIGIIAEVFKSNIKQANQTPA